MVGHGAVRCLGAEEGAGAGQAVGEQLGQVNRVNCKAQFGWPCRILPATVRLWWADCNLIMLLTYNSWIDC